MTTKLIAISIFIILCLTCSAQGQVTWLEEWAKNALALQRRLQRNIAISNQFLIATHNSFNSADTFTVAPNQFLKLTDQLDLGVRNIEIDIHWVNNEVRVCHGFGSDSIGCDFNAPTLSSVLSTIKTWMSAKGTLDDILFINFDDGVYTSSAMRTTVTQRIHQIIDSSIGSKVFGKTHLAQLGRYPTTREVHETFGGRNVLIMSNFASFAGESTHVLAHDVSFPYPTSQIKNFSPIPTCWAKGKDITLATASSVKFPFFYEDRSAILWYWGPVEVGAASPETVYQLMECGFSCAMDQMSNNWLKKFIWTWGPQTSFWDLQPSDSTCTFAKLWSDSWSPTMNKQARWFPSACTASRAYACESQSTPGVWAVTNAQGPWSASPACPSGFSFSVPTTPQSMYGLASALQAKTVAEVWINHSGKN